MKKARLLPKDRRILERLGENLKYARKRRSLTAEMLSERANISRSTLWSLESGKSNVSIESLLNVLSALGLQDDLSNIGADDILGRKLQDAKLLRPKRNPKKR